MVCPFFHSDRMACQVAEAAMPYAEVPALFQAIEVLKSINRVEGSPGVFDSRGNGKPL